MDYIIYKDGVEVNRIVADEAFVRDYYSGDGYSFAPAPPPEPEPAPEPQSDMDLMAQAYREGVSEA